jgi:CubicO group peptidase (beta-lactamase class C family)
MKRTISIVILCWSAFCLSGTAFAQWGGAGCPSEESLRAIVDDAFDTGQPPVAGISVATLKPSCGTFLHARGKRDIVAGKDMTTATKMHIGSMTKTVTGAVLLAVLERAGGPEILLHTPLSQLFSASELSKLTSNCSDSFQINIVDRETAEFVPAVGQCPDFSKVTLWHLIRSHSGLVSLEELDVNRNGFLDGGDYTLGKWLRAAGIPTFAPIAEPTTAFGVLDAYNMYRHPTAMIGGNQRIDFPPSLGNTEYTLLGIILERVTGRPYNTLVKQLITDPLGLDPMLLLPIIPSPQQEDAQQISRGYMDITTLIAADPRFDENANGAYPIVELRGGRPGVDIYKVDSWSMQNSAGGSGALAATMKTYATFFSKFVTGGLLSPAMQEVFNEGFVEIGFGPTVTYGFGVVRQDFQNEILGVLFQKNGALLGTYCIAAHSTGAEVTIVVCTNQRDTHPAFGPEQVPNLVESVANNLLIANL